MALGDFSIIAFWFLLGLQVKKLIFAAVIVCGPLSNCRTLVLIMGLSASSESLHLRAS